MLGGGEKAWKCGFCGGRFLWAYPHYRTRVDGKRIGPLCTYCEAQLEQVNVFLEEKGDENCRVEGK